jgi:hypothetical protein
MRGESFLRLAGSGEVMPSILFGGLGSRLLDLRFAACIGGLFLICWLVRRGRL